MLKNDQIWPEIGISDHCWLIRCPVDGLQSVTFLVSKPKCQSQECNIFGFDTGFETKMSFSDGLAGGCGARAVSRKTPIYFIDHQSDSQYFFHHQEREVDPIVNRQVHNSRERGRAWWHLVQE